MRAKELYEFIEQTFKPELVAKALTQGQSYFLGHIQEGPNSTRIVRISETPEGIVGEIKLSVSSLPKGQPEKFSALPVNLDVLKTEIEEEIIKLEAKLSIA